MAFPPRVQNTYIGPCIYSSTLRLLRCGVSLRLIAASCFVPIVARHETLGVWYQAHGGNDAPNGSGPKNLRRTRFRTTAVPSLSIMPGPVPGAFVSGNGAGRRRRIA